MHMDICVSSTHVQTATPLCSSHWCVRLSAQSVGRELPRLGECSSHADERTRRVRDLPPPQQHPPSRSAARRWRWLVGGRMAMRASVRPPMQKNKPIPKVVARLLLHAGAVVTRPLAQRDERIDAHEERAAAETMHARIEDGHRRLGQTCKITSRMGVSNRITNCGASATRRCASGMWRECSHQF